MPDLEASFPGLAGTDYHIASPYDSAYNCIAWAAGDTQRWWWPSPFGGHYWPEELPRVNALWNFLSAFERMGYERCESADFEDGYEKVAIYGNVTGPTHAARQMPDGSWVSKLGEQIDISHEDVQSLEGQEYGRVIAALRRRA